MKLRTLIRLMAAALLLPACGGGGSTGGSPPPPDPVGFDATGLLQVDPTPGHDLATCIAQDTTHIYIGGNDTVGIGQFLRVEKRSKATGFLDTAFANGGVYTGNAAPAQVRAMAATATHLFIVSHHFNGAAGVLDYEWRIDKISLATGIGDAAFGTSGVVTSNPSVGNEEPLTMTLDGTDVYVGGQDYVSGDAAWRIEKRDLTTGALVAAFASAGVFRSNPTAFTDRVRGLGLKDGSLLVVANSNTSVTDSNWEYRKLDATTGAVDGTFSSGSNPSGGLDYPTGLVVSGSDYLVIGTDDIGGNRRWRVENRSIATNALNFVTISNPSTNDEEVRALALDGGQLYVAGDDESPGAGQWRLERRNASDLTLDATFATAGTYTEDPDPAATELVLGVAVDADSIFLVGMDLSLGQVQWRIRKLAK